MCTDHTIAHSETRVTFIEIVLLLYQVWTGARLPFNFYNRHFIIKRTRDNAVCHIRPYQRLFLILYDYTFTLRLLSLMKVSKVSDNIKSI